jgi:hypothetical protein
LVAILLAPLLALAYLIGITVLRSLDGGRGPTPAGSAGSA